MSFHARYTVYALLMFLLTAASAFASDRKSLLNALSLGDHIALMRHALAPGSGDPANFSLDDCTTQRNLSDQGRAQAQRIGKLLRDGGIRSAKIYTSEWCRCRETAELLGLGKPGNLAIINSFYRAFERRDAQTRQLREWLALQNLKIPVILVTHQVNITALTGIYPASGEIVVLRRGEDGQVMVAGTVKTW